MALETATEIADLVSTNPTSGDPKSQGDDHFRLLKAVLLAEFDPISIGATSGYFHLPGGLLVQWFKTAGVNAGASVTTSFPIAFPTECRFIVATPAGGAVSSSVGAVGVEITSTTQVKVYNWGSNINFTGGVYVLAIGV